MKEVQVRKGLARLRILCWNAKSRLDSLRQLLVAVSTPNAQFDLLLLTEAPAFKRMEELIGFGDRWQLVMHSGGGESRKRNRHSSGLAALLRKKTEKNHALEYVAMTEPSEITVPLNLEWFDLKLQIQNHKPEFLRIFLTHSLSKKASTEDDRLLEAARPKILP